MSETKIKARPTIYEGIQMRSRLEAQFAQILDGFGVDWQYESDCFANKKGQYLPDFLVDCHGEPWWIELKPYLEIGDAADIFLKMRAIVASHPFEATPYHCNLAIACPKLGSLLFMQRWYDTDHFDSGLAMFLEKRWDDDSDPYVTLIPGTGYQFEMCTFDDIVCEGNRIRTIDWPYT